MHRVKLLVLGLASLLVGPGRGISMRLANEKAADDKDKKVTTSRSAASWKSKTALAIHADPTMSDEDLDAAHDKHMAALTAALANDADETDPDAKLANERVAKIEDGKETPEIKLANERTVKAEKKAADMLIANALTEGRILAAAKGEWEGKFANDFTATETALAKETKKIKVESQTKELGKENDIALANESDRRDKVQSLVAAEQQKNGGNYDLAFATVRREHKALFGAMKQPEAKK